MVRPLRASLRQWVSFNFPKAAFDTLDLAILEQTFDSVWDIVQARDPLRDVSRDDELKAALGEKLIALAKTHGVSDAETLRGYLLGDASPASANSEIAERD